MDWSLLKRLSEMSAVPGREDAVRALVLDRVGLVWLLLLKVGTLLLKIR